MNSVLSSQCIEKLEIIGSGSFGRVFKCRDLRTGEFVAVKEIDLDGNGGGDDCFEELRAEISTLMTCEHFNIIRYRGSYVPNNNHKKSNPSSPLSNRLCIVMDYCERGSLRQVLDRNGPLTENVIAEIAESILKALEYLHKQGISHRDLKGANVLVDAGGRVKLGDFGVAFQPEEDSPDDNKLVGSPYWMAPEVLNFSTKHDASKADIWSFGITLIELLRGRPPLHYLSPRAAMSAIPRTSPPRLESDDPRASKRLRDLIHACLHDDPKKRPSASQLLKSFKSYFKSQQKTSTPNSTNSLANFSTKDLKEMEAQDTFELKGRGRGSETIYSQWDFDLSTLNSEALTVNESESSGMSGVSDSVRASDSVRVTVSDGVTTSTTSTVPTVPAVPSVPDGPSFLTNNITTTTQKPVAELPNPPPATNLSFRKLKLSSKPVSENILWDNKDSAILPIPCPSDAPDLTKPQKL